MGCVLHLWNIACIFSDSIGHGFMGTYAQKNHFKSANKNWTMQNRMICDKFVNIFMLEPKPSNLKNLEEINFISSQSKHEHKNSNSNSKNWHYIACHICQLHCLSHMLAKANAFCTYEKYLSWQKIIHQFWHQKTTNVGTWNQKMALKYLAKWHLQCEIEAIALDCSKFNSQCQWLSSFS